MTILSALTNLYGRLQETGETAPPYYSMEKISFALVIDVNGRPLRLADKRSHADEKPAPVAMPVPASVTRTGNIKSNLFWDKTAYALGITAIEQEDQDGVKYLTAGQGKRTAREHECFVSKHKKLLSDTNDPGLLAFIAFLDEWSPEDFETLSSSTNDALDKNIVFEFDDGNKRDFLHNRPAAQDAAQKFITETSNAEVAVCLVTGQNAPVRRVHRPIKRVINAQSSGASLVSFNEEAYESYGKTQGSNAPVSEDAAFAYSAALNALLARTINQKRKRPLQIGDATVVFWAEAADSKKVELSEQLMGGALSPPDDTTETTKIRSKLTDVAEGRAGDDPDLDENTRIYILGLAPNAARLSVRFWRPGTFGDFARNVTRFWDDLHLEPNPWKALPAAWSLLCEIALQGKAENIPPALGGSLMRAVLTGQPLPRLLLSATVARTRIDKDQHKDQYGRRAAICGRRAAICKAVINSRLRIKDKDIEKEGIPMSLDPENTNPAYRLGRLFAVLELTQTKALPNLNATIKDRYFAAASSTPARIFPLLFRNAMHHLALLKKGENKGLAYWLEQQIGEIWGGLQADLPPALVLEDQGRFIAGYYHQRYTKTSAQTNKEGDSE